MADAGDDDRSADADAALPVLDPSAFASLADKLLEPVGEDSILMLCAEGRIAGWNAVALGSTGYPADELAGCPLARLYTSDDHAIGLPARTLANAERVGRSEDEGWRVRRDGSRFWALSAIDAIRDEQGGLVGFAASLRDSTGRRAAQEVLRESEQRFRLLIERVVDHAIFTLDAQGCVADWNASAERAKGYRRAEIVGRSFACFYTEEDQRDGVPERALEAARRDGRHDGEGWCVRQDGTRYWASFVIDPLRDEAGEIVGFVKITRDITERRALDQAREQLHQAQKMETIGQLTGGVAHDFNNLLLAISGSLELIARLTDDARIRRLLDTAQRAAGRGARLTSQLLSFSRRQLLRPEVSDINQLINVFEVLLRQATGEQIELRIDLQPGLWLCDADPAQFQAALLNIVVNARDAMPRGGRLTVETRNVHLDPAEAAALSEVAAGAYVALRVTDTGEGMSPAVRARAIEPFFTTKDVGNGSGLGLSQVYGFARQSNGQIGIHSQVGQGTTVALYLPRIDETALRAGPGGVRKTPVVLVVEDDPDVLEVATEALRTFGYEVIAASNAPQALSILQRDTPIDVLFTDVVMPHGMDGVELATAAAKLRPALRVLLASGYPREALRQRMGLTDGMAFLDKPYSVPQLAETLGHMVGRV